MAKDALASRAEGDSRIPVSLSSEQPVDRWYGQEILDHGTDAVDLSYARDGLPLLVNHDTDRQVGIIEEIGLQHGQLRGMLRFSRSAEAQTIRQDIEDGIRKNVSVGYRINTLKLERSDDQGNDTYRATRWTPMEGSTVPVPADITVGIGRDADGAAFPVSVITPEPPATPVEERKMPDEAAPAPAHKVGTESATLDAQRKSIREIVALARDHGMPEKVDGWLERSLTPDQVAAEILSAKRATAQPVATPDGHVDLSDKEHREFSLQRAILAAANKDWRHAGLEREASDSIAKRLQKEANPLGFFLPFNLRKPFMEVNRAAVTGQSTTSSLGGAGIQTDVLALIDLLRNRMVVRKLGATVLSGLSSPITFPRQITANTLNWTGENPSSANSLGSGTFDNVAMNAKTAMATTAYSRQLLLQNSFDISAWVSNDLAQVAAIGLDLAATNGTGASNQPTGIKGQTGVQAEALGTNGLIPTWANIVQFETDVATQNADIGTMGWLTTPGIRGKLKTVLKSTVAGADFVWEKDNTVNGYHAEVSNQIPSNLSKGTATTICHQIIFGVWSELLIGEFGGAMELIVDPYTYVNQNMIQVVGVMMADIAVKHPKSFAISNDALSS